MKTFFADTVVSIIPDDLLQAKGGLRVKTYVADALAFFHFLLDDLPRVPDEVFKEAEDGRAIISSPHRCR